MTLDKPYIVHFGGKVQDAPLYCGLYSYSNGVSTKRNLKFERPRHSHRGDSENNIARPGEVKIEVYNSEYGGTRAHRNLEENSNLLAASVNHSAIDKKKNLRSIGGSLTSASCSVSSTTTFYKLGQLLYSITLKYCAAPGLIRRGVLPQPPSRWDYHRTLYAADPPNNHERLVPSRTEDGRELLDLTGLESEEEPLPILAGYIDLKRDAEETFRNISLDQLSDLEGDDSITSVPTSLPNIDGNDLSDMDSDSENDVDVPQEGDGGG